MAKRSRTTLCVLQELEPGTLCRLPESRDIPGPQRTFRLLSVGFSSARVEYQASTPDDTDDDGKPVKGKQKTNISPNTLVEVVK